MVESWLHKGSLKITLYLILGSNIHIEMLKSDADQIRLRIILRELCQLVLNDDANFVIHVC